MRAYVVESDHPSNRVQERLMFPWHLVTLNLAETHPGYLNYSCGQSLIKKAFTSLLQRYKPLNTEVLDSSPHE